jgi:hypothetical protein
MIEISDVHVDDLVTFKGDSAAYPVTFVGPKYFHIDIGHGRISGPYTPDLLDEIVRP